MPRWAWGAFAVLFLAHLLDSFDRWLLPVVLRDVSEELLLTRHPGRMAGHASAAELRRLEPVVGYFADRFGRSRLLAVGIAVWSLAMRRDGVGPVVRPARSSSGSWSGVGGSTFGVVALTLLMDLFPRGVRARVLSALLPGDAPGRGPGPGRWGSAIARAVDLAHGVPDGRAPGPGAGPARSALARPAPRHERGRRAATTAASRARSARAGPITST